MAEFHQSDAANVEMEELKRAREQGRRLVERWLVVAGSLLDKPDRLSGKELNRAGELVLAANNWLRDEIKRASRPQLNLDRLLHVKSK